jgi:small subunit ribosomal protein S1
MPDDADTAPADEPIADQPAPDEPAVAVEDVPAEDVAAEEVAVEDEPAVAVEDVPDVAPDEPATAPPPAPVIGQSAPAGSPLPPPATGGPTPASPERRGPGVAVGKIVEVTVVAVLDKEVEVRLADGREGVVPRSEFDGPVSPGDVVSAAQLAREDPRKRAVLSVAWARKQQAWERVEAALADGTPLTGTVAKQIKGGAVDDLGLRGFLPTSLVSDTPGADLAALVGTEVEVLVIEVDRAKERIVVSIRDLERRRRRAQEKELLKALAPGSRATGRVVSIADYGAVVDLGGARGLIHRSELTWGRLESIESIVSVGDQVEVVVLDVNKSKRRIGLSLRATEPDPYEQVEIGAIESATVVRVVEYGVFVRLDSNGAEGLVHISELSDVPGYRPDQLVTPGEQIMVKVLEIDRKRRRLALSVRRVLVDD